MNLHDRPHGPTKASEPQDAVSTTSPQSTEDSTYPNGVTQSTLMVAKTNLKTDHDARHDSGLAVSSIRDSTTFFTTDGQCADSLLSLPNVPEIRVYNDAIQPSDQADRPPTATQSAETNTPVANTTFQGITMDIPSGGMSEELTANSMSFSNRGSMFINGHKVNLSKGPVNSSLKPTLLDRKAKSSSSLRGRTPIKILSTEEQEQSEKVRSYYELGFDIADGVGRGPQRGLPGADGDIGGCSTPSISRRASSSDAQSNLSDIGVDLKTRRVSTIRREINELAGGLEDWQDVGNGEVDRYGFIMPRSFTSDSVSSAGTERSPSLSQRLQFQGISTSLQLASEAPRRRHTVRRSPSDAKSTREAKSPSPLMRQPSKRSNRPTYSQSSYQGSDTRSTSRLRIATNKLPHHKSRRLMDEASDMLTLPPGLEDIAEDGDVGARETYTRRKETEREAKWRKMAKIVSKSNNGAGMVFEFDTHSHKLIERTWKGIPDRWRATAWHCFLSTSAKKRKGSLSDEELIELFNDYQLQSSPDDVQVDIDVPRTISRHIMFRRRYRGGQRLLFRVLHAMSLHFPDTGYVQGMAALAATLLAYYDEGNAFVMLVRLWDHRGLDELYKPGFGGLMEALDDFEKKWLSGGEIEAKLVSSHVDLRNLDSNNHYRRS